MATKRLVIKVGSLAVTMESGGVDQQKISNLVNDIKLLKDQGHVPVLVSSGAINTGRMWIKKDETIASQQAAAALGQPILMRAYIEAFNKIGQRCAQILVTHEDFKDRKRFLNIRNTINCLLENNIIPIVNENDTVSFAEISVGDNDQLAVMMTEAVDAETLVLLTEADGLYNKNPKDPTAKRFNVIDFSDDFSQVQIATKTSVGRGGMDTKLLAIRKLTPLGVNVILGTFDIASPISRLISEKGGTLFLGKSEGKHSRRKAWLSTLVKNGCYLVVDEGAVDALTKRNTSLLPIGIRKVVGKFRRGDIISIKHKNKTIAVGMAEYDAKAMSTIQGKKSSDFNTLIKDAHSKVAIHKDNLLLT